MTETKIRMLLVDDEASILSALRRLLRHEDWHLRLASSGEAGLAALDEEAADIVISDVRMPEMDGLTFLRCVRERHPAAVRVVLTGYAEEEELLVAFRDGDTHEIITKPWDDAMLRERLRTMVAQVTVQRHERRDLSELIRRFDPLPALPAAYAQLQTALAVAEPAIDAVAAALLREPSLAAKVLQIANSSLFGQYRRVETVSRAVVVIGLRSVQALAAAGAAFLAFPDGGDLDRELLWEHGLRVGDLARRLAAGAGADAAGQEEAAVAGLLHDVGKLAFDAHAGADYAGIQRLAAAEHLSVQEAERRQFGCSHALLGGHLVDWWQLPPVYGDILRAHHTPMSSRLAPMLTAAVHVADAVDRRALGDTDACIDAWALRLLDLDAAALEDLGDTPPPPAT